MVWNFEEFRMLKIATSEEKTFYEKKLYPLQDEFLNLIKSDKLDGTALLIKKIDENEFDVFVKDLIKKMVEYAKNR